MKQQLEAAITAIVFELFDQKVSIDLTRTDPKFGDYATNVALQLAKRLSKTPGDIAIDVVAKIADSLNELIAEVKIAGPGFINLTLTDESLVAGLRVSAEQSLAHKRVVMDYSDPNPFKPLHAGHLYTTLVGDAIARLLEASGAEVIRLNYGGDVGRHVAITMWAIVKELGGEYPEKLASVAEVSRPHWLGLRYVEGTAAFEENETDKAEIIAMNTRVYQIHEDNDHDSPLAQIYWTCRTWSYDYFNKLYPELRVAPFDRFIPESEIVPLGLLTVREQLAKGVYVISEGAVVFKGEDFGLHTRVFINSKGLPTYETKDIGLVLTKWRDYHFDRSIVITANEQEQYMEVMLKSLEQFEPNIAARSEHLTHGIVKLKGGIKMSSRKGNTAGALEILEAAAAANLAATGQDNNDTVIGAVKYAFLKARIGGDIIYDPEESVSLEGNSGPYLQYALARACSILNKAGYDEARLKAVFSGAVISDTKLTGLEADERLLVRKLSEYGEVVTKAALELLPHHVCSYLYELAQTFNRFYENNRVIGNDRQALRIELIEHYARTLKSGLTLLGIPTPERM